MKKEQMFGLPLTFYNAKSILHIRGELNGQYRSTKGKKIRNIYSLRMGEQTKTRLEEYCCLLNMTKPKVIILAIDRLRKENDYGENMGCNDNENGLNTD